MKRFILLAVFVGCSLFAIAQTKTTLALQEEFGENLSLFFYKNTLRMLNQKDDKDFDELIRNVEKLKFLMVDKSTRGFGAAEYKKLTDDYKSEAYEPIVTSRFDGRSFDIFLKDKKGTPGTIMLVNDSTNLFVLDIIGTFDVSKAGSLFSILDGSEDVGKMMNMFQDHRGDRDWNEKRKKKKGITID